MDLPNFYSKSDILKPLLISSSDDCSIRFYSQNFKPLRQLITKEPIQSFQISNNKYLITGSQDGTISIYNLVINYELIHQKTNLKQPILSICLIQKDEIILSGGYDGILMIQKFDNLKIIQKIDLEQNIYDIKTNGKQFCILSDDIFIFNCSNLQKIKRIENQQIQTGIFFNNLLICGDQQGQLKLFQQQFEKISQIKAHDDQINSISYCQNQIITGSEDRLVKIFSIDEKLKLKLIKTLKYNYPIKSIQISPDNQFLIQGFQDGSIEINSIENFKNHKTLKHHTDSINFCLFLNLILEEQYEDNLKNEQLSLQKYEFQTPQLYKKQNCSICLIDIIDSQQNVALPCLHNFHKQCLLPWLEKNKICPNCRQDI